ncbi:hypothetical protein GOP47_0020194 [Adiantum capillus-veneris]|uniref:Uncharacterized protein n=1 Tax=Adiantum capillus-veneris TaxID=13818 RepID=A0A9D4Z8F7_ADICA|nr:hypothetical protein GOP47_0020194 [Adiantum capillus-veneris]
MQACGRPLFWAPSNSKAASWNSTLRTASSASLASSTSSAPLAPTSSFELLNSSNILSLSLSLSHSYTQKFQEDARKVHISGLPPQWCTIENTLEEAIIKLNNIIEPVNIKPETVAWINDTHRHVRPEHCFLTFKEQRGTGEASMSIPPSQRNQALDCRRIDREPTQE